VNKTLSNISAIQILSKIIKFSSSSWWSILT